MSSSVLYFFDVIYIQRNLYLNANVLKKHTFALASFGKLIS